MSLQFVAECTTNQNQMQLTPEHLVKQYGGFVRWVVSRVIKQHKIPRHIDRDELYSMGIVGLLEAAKNYREGHGAKFTSFAIWRVQGAIIDGLRKMGNLNRGEYERRDGTLRIFDVDSSAGRNIVDDSAPSAELQVDLSMIRDVVIAAMKKLRGRDPVVVQLCYFDGLSQTEAAKKIGISKTLVSKILRDAHGRLARAMGV